MKYKLQLKGDKDIPFENLLNNLMNEDYNAFYEYKKSANFLDLEKSSLKNKDQLDTENDQISG